MSGTYQQHVIFITNLTQERVIFRWRDHAAVGAHDRFHYDGRISNTDIAKEIGLSEATARTRLNRLIQEEYIQIVAVSNPIKLGFKIVGNIRIHVEIKKMDMIIKELKKLKPLWFIVQTTGGTGIDTEFVVKSLDELNELIFEKINKLDGIALILFYYSRLWGF